MSLRVRMAQVRSRIGNDLKQNAKRVYIFRRQYYRLKGCIEGCDISSSLENCNVNEKDFQGAAITFMYD